jgi:hypothetical protein
MVVVMEGAARAEERAVAAKVAAMEAVARAAAG